MTERNARTQYIVSVILYGMIGTLLRFTNVPGEFAALCRGIIGSVTIFAVISLRGERINVQSIKQRRGLMLLSGVCLGLNWVFLFAAYQTISVAVASLCNYIAPVIVLALSPWVFKTHLNKRQLLCVLAAVTGIVLVSGVTEGSVQDINLKGLTLGLLSALCFVGIILCNRFIKGMAPMDKTFAQLAIASVVMIPCVSILCRGMSIRPDIRSLWILILVGVVNTGIAYILYFNGIAGIPLQSVAILGYLEPVESVILSALVLHEPLSLPGMIGAVLIIGAALCSELIR